MADSFASRFAAVRSRWGPLVWGLDPSGPLLEAWGLGDCADGLDRFADIVLEAAAGTIGLVKPQSAFYERHGWRGTRTLQRLLAGPAAPGCWPSWTSSAATSARPTMPTPRRSSVPVPRSNPTP